MYHSQVQILLILRHKVIQMYLVPKDSLYSALMNRMPHSFYSMTQ